MPDWALEVTFPNHDDLPVAAEMLGALFHDLGSSGWQEQPDLQSGPPRLLIFFPPGVAAPWAAQQILLAADALRAEGVLRSTPHVAAADVPPTDWVAEFRRGFHRARLVPGLWVVPPWEAGEPNPEMAPGEIELLINPGQAFGTGLHETTRLCLTFLQRAIRGGERVLDIGAGSGILSIAAIRLGARAAVAVEVDPQAEENLRENLRLNRVEAVVQPFIGDAALFALDPRRRPEGFDLLICNVLAERMHPLLSFFPRLRRGDAARVILSGYLWNERGEFAARIRPIGVAIEEERQEGEWGALLGRLR